MAYQLSLNYNIGHLHAVGSLSVGVTHDFMITLTWTPPFTLDITGVEPDITGYCVDVISSSTLYSSCEINVTRFSYTLPPQESACNNFTLVVIPVNVVGNGTPEEVFYSHAEEGMHSYS
jgi:hypothetical protein